MKNFTKTLKPLLFAFFLGTIAINVYAQNNALDFDGTNDYVKIPYSSVVSTIYSVQVSVKMNISGGGRYQCVVACGGKIGTQYKGFGIFAQPDNTWALLLGNDGSSYIPVQGPAISFGTWTTLTATYDGIAAHLYVDGVLYASLTTPVAVNPSLPIVVGADDLGSGPADFFSGQMDELSMWKSILSPARVTSIQGVNLDPSKEANLSFYYKFNEGIPNGNNTSPAVNTLIDQTSNNFTGTLSNFALNGNTSNWVGSSLVLPITLANFSGIQKDGSNLLQWSTKSEQNSAYFEIQRSENGSDFTSISKVNAAGNSNLVKSYQYNDNELGSSSVYYYRLKMVDIDGTSKFSPVIFIRNSNSGLTTVYPNPARNQITINVSDKGLINTQALLSDLSGKVLQRISLNQVSTQVDISRYGSGMYLLKFKDGKTIKIVKE
jgi:hypothetical protein